MLKEAGVVFPKQDSSTVRDIAVLKKDNTRKEDAIQQLVQLKGIEAHEAERIVNEVYNRDDIDLASMAGDPEKLIESLMAWLNQNHTIKKNAITGYYEEKGQNLSKEALNGIYLRAKSVFNSPNVTFDLVERIIFSPFTVEYNPITSYINKNLHRNKDGQINTLIQTINSETLNYHIYIRKWMLSLIAAYEGHPVRSVLSLVGGQRTGKTEWFRRLLPDGLKKYYAESKLDAGKDDDILMCQKLIVMDDEMGGKSKQDEKRFKELTSKSIFSLRAPYGRTNEDFKRLAVLCGTSNDLAIINDPTGNTRILPVNVVSINHELFNSIDKDELFMECYRAYVRGDEWQLNRSEFAVLNELTTDFEAIPVERELIMLYFAANSETGMGKKYLTASQIKMHIEINSKQQIKNVKIFGAELKRLFGVSVSKRIDGQILKVYPVYEVNNSQGFNSQQVEDDETPF
jgi:predicted P-loop ATPase